MVSSRSGGAARPRVPVRHRGAAQATAHRDLYGDRALLRVTRPPWRHSVLLARPCSRVLVTLKSGIRCELP